MQVACLELLVSNRIVVFQLFLRTKLGGNVLQITIVCIAGRNSRGSGLKTPPQDMNALEICQPLLSQISCVPQRLLQIQLLCRCFTPTLGLLCPGVPLCAACPPHWPSLGDNGPLLLHRAMSEQDVLSHSLFQLLSATDQRPESLSALCFLYFSHWHREARRERKYFCSNAKQK